VLDNVTPLPEIALRVALIYAALVVMIRIAGKREVGQLTPLDLLAMLLLSETVSPALTGQDGSLPAALVAAATLIALTMTIGRITYRSPRAERWFDGAPVVLARDGDVDPDALERERISRSELEAALRKKGVRSAADTELVTLEADGSISVVVPRR
jgi:uncharacterized membrane protein YcaP (DUF421 family)